MTQAPATPLVDDPTTRVVLTVALLATLALAWLGVQRAGQRARARFDERRVEIAQLAVVTGLVAVTAVAIVFVWDAVTQIRDQVAKLGANPKLGVWIVVSLLVVAVAYGITRIASRLVTRPDLEEVPSDHRREVAFHVIQVTVYGIAALVVLTIWRVDLANLLLGAGFLGLVLGLAARQTLGAVLAGFVLLFARPFEVGEWVEIGESEGVVTDVSIVNTRLRTFDGEYVLIPNDRVTGRDIVNRSREGRLRGSVEVGVDYETDLDAAVEAAEAAMDDCDRVLESPRPHVVGKRFGDSAVVLELRYWVEDPSARRMWRARTDVVGAVKDAYEREGIDIPFPQRSISAREEVGVRLEGEQS